MPANTGVIIVNDAGLEAWQDQTLATISPGFAVLESSRMLLGNTAFNSARLNPQLSNHRFWSELNTHSMYSHANVRHHVDIAHAHLGSVWQGIRDSSDVILSVPASFDTGKVSLLAGIAEDIGIPVRSMIYSGLGSLVGQAVSSENYYLDIQLTTTTVTRISASTTLKFEECEIIDTGITNLWDAVVRYLQELMIQGHRFDPMKEGDSEQTLYSAIPAWLNSGSNTFSISHYNQNMTVKVDPARMIALTTGLVSQLVRAIESKSDATVYLSHRIAGIPGVTDRMKEVRSTEPVTCDPESEVRGMLKHFEDLRRQDNSLHLYRELPSADDPIEQDDTQTTPTHFVINSQLFEIGTEPTPVPDGDGVVISGSSSIVTVDNPDSADIKVNGSTPPSEAAIQVKTGDSLELPAGTVVFLRNR
jgi:hypothetical protein